MKEITDFNANGMTIAIAADHGGVELKKLVSSALAAKGHKVVDFGTDSTESCDYPDFGTNAAFAVADGKADACVLICRSGIGMSIAANKHKGIRAALCGDTYSAKMTRQHNDANVLCMGARVIGSCLAQDIVDSFLDNGFEGGRHAVRVGMIADIEKSQK